MSKASAVTPITWVGMDAHVESIEIARLAGASSQSEAWQLEYTPQAVRRLMNFEPAPHPDFAR